MPVHAPAHLPCCVASPITHTPVRSESARLSAPRGGCCRFVMRSAGSSRQQVCDDRLGCVGILTATGLCSWRCSFVSGAHGMPNAAWRQCDVRATATASDGMLLSGVPILGCRSPPPLGPTFAIQEIGLGLLPCSSLACTNGNTWRLSMALPAPARACLANYPDRHLDEHRLRTWETHQKNRDLKEEYLLRPL